MVEAGELIALLMLPEEFGGDHRRENVVYVPPFVAQLKDHFDRDTVRRLAEEGKTVEYGVKPAYAGKSMVPTGITITATTPSIFAKHIAIWKPASDQTSD